MPEPLTPEEVAVLVNMIHAQRAEIAHLRSNQSLLDVIREIARDPTVPAHLRLKAAEAGVAYETPKLSATVNTNRNLTIATRLDELARRKLTVIEGGPDPTRADGGDM